MQEDYLDIYLLSLSATGKTSTRSKLKRVSELSNISDPHEYPWTELNFVKVSYILDDLKKAGLSGSTINATLSAIKGVCKAAWSDDAIDGDVYAKIKSIENIKVERLPTGQSVSYPDIEKMFNSKNTDDTKDLRDSVILSLGFDLGLRREEISSLKRSDIDFYEDEVKVIGKGNKERAVPLNPRSRNLLTLWFEKIEFYKAAGHVPGDKLLGKTSKSHHLVNLKGLNVATVWEVVKASAINAGLDLKQLPTTHDMRRTKITSWLDNGDARVVQQLAGHKHIQTTMGYDRGDLKEQMRSVQDKSS